MKKILLRVVFLVSLSSAFSADKYRTAVMTLEAEEGVDKNIAHTITGLLNSELVNLQIFTMIDRQNIQKIMQEQAFQQQGCTDQACAVKLGNILNVQKIIVGSVMKLGTQFIINVNFVDVELSQIDLSVNITAGDENALMTAVAELAKKIAGKVNISGHIVRISEDGKILCNIGSADNAETGMVLTLTRVGVTLVDEETGEFLGREIINLGKAKIVNFSGKMLSEIEPEKGSKPLKIGDKVEMPLLHSKKEKDKETITAAKKKPEKKVSGKPAARGTSPVILAAEAGNGAIGGILAELRLHKKPLRIGEFGLGAAGAYDFRREDLSIYELDMHYFCAAGFLVFHFKPVNSQTKLIIDVRIKGGWSYLMVPADKEIGLSRTGAGSPIVSPELCLGWGPVYVIASLPVFIKSPAPVPQIGLGVRIRL